MTRGLPGWPFQRYRLLFQLRLGGVIGQLYMHLNDTTTICHCYLELVTINVDRFAAGRQMAEGRITSPPMVSTSSSLKCVSKASLKSSMEARARTVQCGGSAGGNRYLLLRRTRLQFPDDELKDILDGHQARDAAEFVNNDRHMIARVSETLSACGRPACFPGTTTAGRRHFSMLEGFGVAAHKRQQILAIRIPSMRIFIFTDDRETRVGGFDDDIQALVQRPVAFQGYHFVNGGS